MFEKFIVSFGNNNFNLYMIKFDMYYKYDIKDDIFIPICRIPVAKSDRKILDTNKWRLSYYLYLKDKKDFGAEPKLKQFEKMMNENPEKFI